MPLSYAERAARRKEIAAFVAAGATTAEAAAKFGVSRGRAWAACRENGVTLPAAETQTTAPATYQIIAALCAGGETLTSIAARHAVTKQRVSEIYSACRAAGIPVRRRTRGAKKRKTGDAE
jgi:hypothetical protein